MKRLAMVLVVICGVMVSGIALASELAPVDVRGNGGYELGVLMVDVNDLNDALGGLGYSDLSPVVIVHGGGGMGGSRSDLRLGGYGCGGDVVSKTDAGDIAVLSMGFGGFVCEKGFYVKDNTDLAVGAMFGGGGATLELTRANSENSDEYGKGFVALEPRVSLHHQIYGHLGIEVRASYLLTYDFHTNWQIGEASVAGPFRFFGGPHLGVRLTFGF